MAAKTYRRFFQDGRAAFERGLSKTRCPHPPGSIEHQSWLNGWVYAERQADEEIMLTLSELLNECPA